MASSEVAINFFPYRLDRATAPEVANHNGARILHNIGVSPWTGRLRRRLGMCPTSVATLSTDVIRCLAMQRDDGQTLMFDVASNGTMRVTVGAVASYAETDYWGARTSQSFRENFQEDGY